MKVGLWLHRCPDCESELVEALDARDMNDGRWNVSMRCPECWLEWGGIASNRLLEELEQRVHVAHAELQRALERVTRENMSDSLDCFVAALAADAVLPMDF
jgi:hypothetical protein